jgi:hypothetical protein
MKKVLILLSFTICLMLLSTNLTFADNMNRNKNTSTGIRTNGNNGMNGNYRTLGTDSDRIDRNNNGATLNTNTYRANAATDNDGFDWGWLGLLGLLGFAGMRGRDRDRT